VFFSAYIHVNVMHTWCYTVDAEEKVMYDEVMRTAALGER